MQQGRPQQEVVIDLGEWKKTGDFSPKPWAAGLFTYECEYKKGKERIKLEATGNPKETPTIDFEFFTEDQELAKQLKQHYKEEPVLHTDLKIESEEGINKIFFRIYGHNDEEVKTFLKVLHELQPLPRDMRIELYRYLRLERALSEADLWDELKKLIDAGKIEDAINRIKLLDDFHYLCVNLAWYCEHTGKIPEAIKILREVPENNFHFWHVRPKLERLKPEEKKEEAPQSIPEGQTTYINARAELGYPKHPGLCFGVAFEGMLSLMAEEIEQFATRYQMLTNVSPDKLKRDVEEAHDLIKTFSQEAKKELEEKYRSEWKETKQAIQREKKPEEWNKEIAKANVRHQQKYNQDIQLSIEKQLDLKFQDKPHDRKRFDRLIEMHAAAEVTQVITFPPQHKDLLGEEPAMYVMDKLPNEFKPYHNAYIFIRQFEHNPPVRLYRINSEGPKECEMADRKKAAEMLEEKNINSEMPLQKQPDFSKEKVDALWKNILFNPIPDPRKSRDLRAIPDYLTDLLTSKKMEEKGGVTPLALYSGIYNKNEIAAFLKELQSIIDRHDPKPNNSLGMMLSTLTHTISINYLPKTKEWVLVDANQLFTTQELPKKTFTDLDKLANEMVEAFDCQNVVCLSTKLFSTQNDSEVYKKCVNQWMQTEAFKKAHSVTKEKAKLQDDQGEYWLHEAFIVDDDTTVDQLLRCGADPACIPKKQLSVHGLAVGHDYSESVKKFLNYIEDVNKSITATEYTPAIVFAAQLGLKKVVETLLAAKNIDPRRSCKASTKILIDLARSKNREEQVKTLLRKYDLLNEGYGRFSAMEWLLNQLNGQNNEKFEGFNALHAAAFFGHNEVLKLLLPHDKNEGIALIDIAFAMGYFDMAKMLLEHEIAKRSEANNPLHHFARIILQVILADTSQEKEKEAYQRYELFIVLDKMATQLLNHPYYALYPERFEKLKQCVLETYKTFSETKEIEGLRQLLDEFKKSIRSINQSLAHAKGPHGLFNNSSEESELQTINRILSLR